MSIYAFYGRVDEDTPEKSLAIELKDRFLSEHVRVHLVNLAIRHGVGCFMYRNLQS
jgi:hypothetical protein